MIYISKFCFPIGCHSNLEWFYCPDTVMQKVFQKNYFSKTLQKFNLIFWKIFGSLRKKICFQYVKDWTTFSKNGEKKLFLEKKLLQNNFFLVLREDGRGPFCLFFWKLHKIWIQESTVFFFVWFGQCCIISWDKSRNRIQSLFSSNCV